MLSYAKKLKTPIEKTRRLDVHADGTLYDHTVAARFLMSLIACFRAFLLRTPFPILFAVVFAKTLKRWTYSDSVADIGVF